jgi:hypothetical protein
MGVNRYLVKLSYRRQMQAKVWIRAKNASHAMIKALEAYKHRISHITSCCVIGQPIPVCKRRRKQQQAEQLPDRAERYKAKERPKPPSVFDI